MSEVPAFFAVFVPSGFRLRERSGTFFFQKLLCSEELSVEFLMQNSNTWRSNSGLTFNKSSQKPFLTGTLMKELNHVVIEKKSFNIQQNHNVNLYILLVTTWERNFQSFHNNLKFSRILYKICGFMARISDRIVKTAFYMSKGTVYCYTNFSLFLNMFSTK